MSHTRLAAESHKHRCWRVSALLINTASLQTCSDLTPDMHSNASRDLSVKSLGSQITSRLFSLVIKVCLMLIQSRVSSLIWMLLDKNAEHVRCVLTSIRCSCEAPSLGSGIFFSHNIVTYLLKPSQYHIPGGGLDNWSECVSRSVVSDSLWPQGLQPSRLLCPLGFSRQEYCSGLMFASPRGYPPELGIKPGSVALHVDSLLSEPPGKNLIRVDIRFKNIYCSWWPLSFLFSKPCG